MPAKRTKIWTKESVLQESKKYKTRTEFAHGSPGAFQAAWKKGWLPEMVWHVPKVRNWTKEAVFEESHKYTSRTEFARNCVGAYMAAKRKWLARRDDLATIKSSCQMDKGGLF